MFEPQLNVLKSRFELITAAKDESQFFNRIVEYVSGVLNDPAMYLILQKTTANRIDVERYAKDIEKLALLYLYSLERKDWVRLIGGSIDDVTGKHVHISLMGKEFKKLLAGNEGNVLFSRKEYEPILEKIHFDLLKQAEIEQALKGGEEVLQFGSLAIFTSQTRIRAELNGKPVRSTTLRPTDLWLLKYFIRSAGQILTFGTLSVALKGPTGFESASREEITRAISRLKKIPELATRISVERGVGYRFSGNIAK
ncbi:hypothetical protein IPG41_02725 [Candidatus Peregrinibacteria bacterium]|nr:MAG: hypothetical protein IPG41_02725 [Candidatus Peregrinibacteria bacterium]